MSTTFYLPSVSKYTPDQARDDHGRFGAGSGQMHRGADPSFKAPSREAQDEAINSIKDQLEVISNMTGGRGSDAYVLQHGQPYHMDDKTFSGPRGPSKQCFMNSARAALDSNGKLTYVEGQAHIGPLAIAHAWTVDKDGIVRDPTFTAGKPGSAVTARGYFGVPFTAEQVYETMARTGMYGIISHSTNPDLFKDQIRVKKYSPDQPRDDHGRFGEGSGDSKTVSADGDHERIRNVIATSDADPRVRAAEAANLEHGDSRMDSGVLDGKGHYTIEADKVNRSIAESFMNPLAKNLDGSPPSAV